MTPAAITGVGLACPLGLRSRSAQAAIRAGITRFCEVDEVAGAGGPARASRFAGLGPGSSRTERAATFAHHALQEVVAGLGPVDALPCFLALPEPDIGPRIDTDALIAGFAGLRTGTGAPLRLDIRPDQIVTAGRAGVFLALEAALAVLARGEQRCVLVGGVDSLVDDATLRALADRNRLLGPTQPDGIIPGEGAGFLALSLVDASGRPPGMARLVALATTREPLPPARAKERLAGAEGLTALFHQLRAGFGGRTNLVYAGTTGEAHFARQFSCAYLRCPALMPEPLRHEPVSDALGDVGAFAGAACLVQAVVQVPRLRALAYAVSDTGLVGGCILAPLA